MSVDRLKSVVARDRLAVEKLRRRVAHRTAAIDVDVDAVDVSAAAAAALAAVADGKANALLTTVNDHESRITALEGVGPGGLSVSSVDVVFDADDIVRVNVTDAAVESTSRIIGTLRRPNIEDADDVSYVFVANVVKVSAGSFDLVVTCPGMILPPPSETVQFHYFVFTP